MGDNSLGAHASGTGPSSFGPSPTVSAVPASVPCAWRPDGFRVAGNFEPLIVAGWTNGTFGIDRRAVSEEAWAITHIPTGYSVCAFIEADLSDVCSFADILLALADWSFTDASESKARSGAMKDALSRVSLTRVSAETLRGPRGMHAVPEQVQS